MALGIAVSGSAVYVSGFVSGTEQTPCYWLGGQYFGLPLPVNATGGWASSAAASGTAIYFAGYISGTASNSQLPCYWESGVYRDLPLPIGATRGQAMSVIVSGSDIYFAGQILDAQNNYIPCYWKNRTYTALPVPLNIALTGGGSVYALATDGAKLYAAGGQAMGPLFGSMDSVANQVAKPTFSPVAGIYPTSQTVTISCATSGATIYYTTDGSNPTTSAAVYVAPIPVASSQKIKAFAILAGKTDSIIASATYVIGQIPACSWEDGVLASLPCPNSSTFAMAWGAAVFGGTAYYSGYHYSGQSQTTALPCYWTGGVYHDLPLPAGAMGGQALWCAAGE
jgi:hypothetical protein